MASIRGRSLASFGQSFTPYMVAGSTPVTPLGLPVGTARLIPGPGRGRATTGGFGNGRARPGRTPPPGEAERRPIVTGGR